MRNEMVSAKSKDFRDNLSTCKSPRSHFTLPELCEILTKGDDWQAVKKFMHEKRFTAKDSDATYRAVNYWTEQGLLDDSRDGNAQQWRRLSFLDILWLRVLRELRDFGLSHEKLGQIY